MRRVSPKVFLVGEMKLNIPGLHGYLEHAGAPGWFDDNVGDAQTCSDAELLVEVMGRLCYRSWKPGMNANVTKVREGNDVYLKNIENVRHGSVIEHAAMSFIFADVSRVFTHEIVRHRVGVAISQESLRYVRLTDLGLWLPPDFENDKYLRELFESEFRTLEHLQLKMADYLKIDDPSADFERKKRLTSAMRRLAPIGLATAIGLTMNGRALRHILELRTSGAAEEEMRLVIDQLGTIAKSRWPNLVQDFERKEDGTWATKNSKI